MNSFLKYHIFSLRAHARYYVLVVIVFLAPTTFLFSQDISNKPLVKKVKHLTAYIGLQQQQDNSLVGFRHEGFHGKLEWGKDRISSILQGYSVSAGFSKQRTGFEADYSSVAFDVRFMYRYLFTAQHKLKSRFFIGPVASVNYQVSHYPNWDESHLYWVNHLDWGVQTINSWQVGEEQQLTAKAEISLLSVLSLRPVLRNQKFDDFSVKGLITMFHNDVKLKSVGQFINARVFGEYKFYFSRQVHPSIGYSIDYLQADDKEKRFLRLGHSLYISFYF